MVRTISINSWHLIVKMIFTWILSNIWKSMNKILVINISAPIFSFFVVFPIYKLVVPRFLLLAQPLSILLFIIKLWPVNLSIDDMIEEMCQCIWIMIIIAHSMLIQYNLYDTLCRILKFVHLVSPVTISSFFVIIPHNLIEELVFNKLMVQ